MLAKDNGWGYTRIVGELRKLGIKAVSRNTVKNILKRYGYDPGPKRGTGTWDEFLKIHVATLWQCDFFSKKVLTTKGFRDLFVLVFLHAETRRVFISPSTFHPNEACVNEQARAFLKHIDETGLGATIVMHDRDTKFAASFDKTLKSAGFDVKRAAYRSPNTNALVERFIQTLQQECLDYFVIFGEQHMDHLTSEFSTHYHTERPHQSKANDLLLPAPAAKKGKRRGAIPIGEIGCTSRLGGLLKHYFRKAA